MPAERALHDRDHDVALHRGADHGREALEQAGLDRGFERDGGADRALHGAAVAQQEEQQVHRDAERDDEVENVLAEVDRAAGECLAALRDRGHQARLHGRGVV
jgi:hypothetical protein